MWDKSKDYELQFLFWEKAGVKTQKLKKKSGHERPRPKKKNKERAWKPLKSEGNLERAWEPYKQTKSEACVEDQKAKNLERAWEP